MAALGEASEVSASEAGEDAVSGAFVDGASFVDGEAPEDEPPRELLGLAASGPSVTRSGLVAASATGSAASGATNELVAFVLHPATATITHEQTD